MADTNFSGFTPVTSLLGTDVFLAARGAAGVNFSLATLFRNIPNGSAAAPGIAFGADQDAGIYSSGPGVMRMVTGGASRLVISDFGISGVNGGFVGTSESYNWLAMIKPASDWPKIAYGNGKAFVVSESSADSISNVAAETYAEVFRATTGYLRPGSDNTKTTGQSSYRWSTGYFGTAPVVTSDEREKLWIGIGEDRRSIWLRIARAIVAELGFYQWLDQVAVKGEDQARLHFGARAQRVWAIVAAEGLCAPLIGEGADQRPDPDWDGPPPPAMLCYDAWDAETEERPILSPSILNGEGEPMQAGTETVVKREAGNRFGFRTDQLSMLLAWATHEQLAALEAMPQAA